MTHHKSFPVLAACLFGLISKLAFAADATPPDQLTVLDGFKVELIYSVPKKQQGSWVCMTPDDRRRLICSDQSGGLYRVTPPKLGQNAGETRVEKLNMPIGQAHGLLWAYDSLYVTVNGKAAQGSGFYRVRDTDGDDSFDEVRLLKKFKGAGEHGPHGIRLGPDGLLYVICGNYTDLPSGLSKNSPHKKWADDLLRPVGGVRLPGGWIARTDKDGKMWDLFCAGFRNPYDLAFNQQGELFTYDADSETDIGTSWYRATRINHAVSAGEYGWRNDTGKWPDYYVDSLGSVVDIGVGSPTGIAFGTNAKFPAKYQRALFICDWAWGTIYAVHMQPSGASYSATFERFIVGKPLPVTDVAVGSEGALYFTVGGRGTQSALYRVTYSGDESTKQAKPIDSPRTVKARATRRMLEQFHSSNEPEAVEASWPYLSSDDRSLRFAARLAIENQSVDLWRERALKETRPTAKIQALLALIRSGKADNLQTKIIEQLNQLPLERFGESQMLDALRVYMLAFIRLGGSTPTARAKTLDRLDKFFPASSELVNRELCRLLIYLEAPHIVARSLGQLRVGQTQQNQIFYVFELRHLKNGWTTEQRKAYFSWLNLAESKYESGAKQLGRAELTGRFTKLIRRIRNDAVSKLTAEEKSALKSVIEGREQIKVVQQETTRRFLHNWQMSDLRPLLNQAGRGRSFEKGQAAFAAAQCAKCHRFRGAGETTGPDLTGVGNRFNAQYLLEAMILPSKVISDQYRGTVIVTTEGEVITGRIAEQNDQELRIRTDPFARELVKVKKSAIEVQRPAAQSEMPKGLINVLTKEEILDLIAYMRSGGNREDAAFKP